MNYTTEELAGNLVSQSQAEADLLSQAIARKDRAVRLLDPALSWSDYRFRWVWDSLRSLLAEGSNTDLKSVADRLREHPDVVNHPMGASQVSTECLTAILAAESLQCTESEFDSLFLRCKNASLARKTSKFLTDLQRNLAESPSKVASHIEAAITQLAQLAGGNRQKAVTSMSFAEAVAQEVALINEGKDREGMIDTFLHALNRAGGECFGGQFIVVAAQPGAGKTTFVLQWARWIARKTQLPVYFEEGEMAVREMARRGICSITGKTIKNTTEDDRAYAVEVAALEPSLQIECAGGKLKEFLARVHLWMQLHPKTVAIFVDYIGLLQDHSASANANNAASEVSDALKGLAQDYGVLVVGCQQPNRKVDSRADKAPQLGDIRDSAKLEQDAHKIFFLARPCKWDKTKPTNLVELHVLKNRDGPAGVIEMAWSPETYTFSDWEDRLPVYALTDGQRRVAYVEDEDLPFEELGKDLF